MKIRKGEREIEVSPKAFRLLYEEQGYVEVEAANDAGVNLQEMKVEKLRELAKVSGIKGYADMRKAELLKALEERGEEDVGFEEREDDEEYFNKEIRDELVSAGWEVILDTLKEASGKAKLNKKGTDVNE